LSAAEATASLIRRAVISPGRAREARSARQMAQMTED
jgi:hypothetical protein